MPRFIGGPCRGIFGIGQDESEAAGVLKKPLIFRESFELRHIVFPVDAVCVDEVDRQMFRIPVFAVARQSDPFRGFAME